MGRKQVPFVKTLIFNGSPKKHGDTETLIDEMVKYLDGEIRILSCESNIMPCNDCRFCWRHSGCSIDDEMQDVYPYMDECDNIIIASPIWFSSLSGPLLNLASRVQTLFAAGFFRNESMCAEKKNGIIIIVGAEKGTEVIPTQNALTIMKFMNVQRPVVATIYSLDTNNIPAKDDKKALAEAREAALRLNKLCQQS